jgi:hypothetical protein
VAHPDDVSVRSKSLRRGALLEVRVHPEVIFLLLLHFKFSHLQHHHHHLHLLQIE